MDTVKVFLPIPNNEQMDDLTVDMPMDMIEEFIAGDEIYKRTDGEYEFTAKAVKKIREADGH